MTTYATEQQTRAALLDSQRRVLERIANGAPLAEILQTLVGLIEAQADGMRCAVLLVDAQQQRLRFAAAPSLPEEFQRAMEPHLFIAPGMAPCGVAAFTRQPVYVRDAQTDPLCEGWSEVARTGGIRAAWSTPILSDANAVLGTFAMFYGEPRLPAEEHIQLIDMATQMARVAIEAKHSEEILRMVFETAPGAMFIADLDGNIVRANEAFATMLGWTVAQLRGRKLAEITPDEDDPPLTAALPPLGDENVTKQRRYLRKAGGTFWAREHPSLWRDAEDRAQHVLVRVDQLSDAGDDPLQRLSPREREVLDLVIAGHTSKEIAARLCISATSVDTYRSRLMLKLDIKDVPGLVRFAIRRGIATV